jgi:hypothetical protein
VATEQQARQARDAHQNKLAAAGAHSLSVEPLPGDAKEKPNSFGVVAWVKGQAPKQKNSLPDTLEIEDQGEKIKVPLVIRQSKPFELE